MVGGRSDGKLLCSVDCLDPLTKQLKMLLSKPWKILPRLPFDVHKHGLAVLGEAYHQGPGLRLINSR